MRQKLAPIERLLLAIDRYSLARAEATWTNGYRAGKRGWLADAEDRRLCDEEQVRWNSAERAHLRLRRLAFRLLREARHV
jgi:hypothetical protein